MNYLSFNESISLLLNLIKAFSFQEECKKRQNKLYLCINSLIEYLEKNYYLK